MNWYEIKNQAKHADIYIFDVIVNYAWDEDEVTAKGFIDELNALGDLTTITVHINSPGGSVYAGNVIHNVLKRHPAKVTVMIDGLAASIASVVAMAGDEVIMPKNAMMMIHDPMSICAGNSTDMRACADMLDKAQHSIVTSYTTKTGQTDEKIKELMRAETWMTATEAVELGFADTIEHETQIAALDGFDLSAFKHPPEKITKLANNAPGRRPPTAAINQPPNKGATPMDLEQLKNEHPELVAQLEKDAVTAAADQIKAEAAAAELKRIQDVEAQLIPGHEDLIAELKADGKTTGPEAAVKVLQAEKEKGQQNLQNMRNDGTGINVPASEPGNQDAGAAKQDEIANNMLAGMGAA
jgi:ATP-dependent Clp endopeptidase proteolytic subunit ClpP